MTAAMTLALPAGLCPLTREPDEARRLCQEDKGCPGEGQRSEFAPWGHSPPTHTWHKRMAVMLKKKKKGL